MNYNSISLWLNLLRWGWQPQVVVACVVAVVLFASGGKGQAKVSVKPPGRSTVTKWQALSFYAGIFFLVLALQSPIDALSEYSFAWHMTQHMIIMLVVPPLCLAGAPLPRFLATLERFGLKRTDDMADSLRRSICYACNPKVAIPLFIGVLWISHLPVIYDFSLNNALFHETEHLVFLAVALLYWGTVIDIAPYRSENSYPRRIAFLGLGILACWSLGVVLLFAVGPLYRPYLALPGATLRGLMGDQNLGSSIMWAPSMIPFDVFLTVYIQRWLTSLSAADRVAATDISRALGTPPSSVADS